MKNFIEVTNAHAEYYKTLVNIDWITRVVYDRAKTVIYMAEEYAREDGSGNGFREIVVRESYEDIKKKIEEARQQMDIA